jgi:hypothetical protein
VREMRNPYILLVLKPERKRSLVRSRCRWENTIIVDVREFGGSVWTGFFWLRIGTDGGFLLTRLHKRRVIS